ncbi:DUF222 domain-containing protein [Actinopolymorpha singaporensis]
MHSTTWKPPSWDGGGDAEQRLEAALVQIGGILDEALAGPMLSLRAEGLGRLLELHGVDEAKLAALKLAMVARGEACDVAKTTGAAATATWLRTAQRMSKNEAAATVGLARDLDRTVTLTAAALARGELSLKHAQVIAFAVRDLPAHIGPEQRVKAEEYLITWSKRRNPDDIRLLGRALLQYLAPEEWERRLGKELDDAERAAERKRSLRYIANGIPGSETVVVKLPAVEMEALRKVIETLIARDNAPEPYGRPLDQKRGDAFAELVAQMAEWQASPNRGRGRDCVTVTIGLDQLLRDTGFGTMDDTTPVRPIPCGCQTPEATRQADRRNRKQCDGKQGSGKERSITNFKPTKDKNKSGEDTDGTRRAADAGGGVGTSGGVGGPDVTSDVGETVGSATPAAQECEPGREKPPPDTPRTRGVCGTDTRTARTRAAPTTERRNRTRVRSWTRTPTRSGGRTTLR